MENIRVQREKKLVIKAGGSILSHKASFESTANSIMSHLDTYDRIFAVVSAPNGITDMITRLLDSPDESERVMILNRIRENLLLTGCSRDQADSTLENIITYSSLFNRTGKPAYLDLALIQGELFSSMKLESVLRQNGSNSAGIMDPSRFLSFRRNSKNELELDQLKTESSFKSLLKSMESYRILIVPGFYGKNGKGRIITIGRGGSDLTASIMSILTHADKLEFWKDVNGIYSMDPRHYSGSVRIPEISMQNAALLDLLGSRILQERSITSLLNHNDLPGIEVKATASNDRGTILGNKNAFDFLISILDNASIRIYLKKFDSINPLKLQNISSSNHISVGHNLFMEISRGSFKRMNQTTSTVLSTKFHISLISIFIGDYLGRYSYSFFKRLKLSIGKNFPESDIYYSQELNIIFIPGSFEIKHGILNCIKETAQEVQESWTK